ncbi:MAG: hypothetical protein GY696_18725 [Gammaproteobacteria bacterium]|nr:hypothetical protein [Gammaproteobacteria bacterium]
MQASYVARIIEWPMSTTPKELNTLLGFLRYYRQFILDFAVLEGLLIFIPNFYSIFVPMTTYLIE